MLLLLIEVVDLRDFFLLYESKTKIRNTNIAKYVLRTVFDLHVLKRICLIFLSAIYQIFIKSFNIK